MYVTVKFYGTRGSIPICGPKYQTFGGNTTCLQITDMGTNRVAIIDAGTGIRELGNDLIASGYTHEDIYLIFTHFHWDHIQGFPFFGPGYDPDRKIYVLVLGKGRKIKNLRDIFARQMQQVYFPVQLDNMGAQFKFLYLDKPNATFRVAGSTTEVSTYRHQHPGGAYSYRFDKYNKSMVFCTDIEHGDEIDQGVVEFSRGADLLIHEAQFSTQELKTKKGWGHSSYDQAIQVAKMAAVDRLVITHHDPNHDDDFLLEMEKRCQRRFPNCVFAREKMEIEL